MSEIDIHIRPFRESDQVVVRQLILTGLAEHFKELDPTYNMDLADINNTYLRKGHLFIVAEDAGQIVGTGGLLREAEKIGRIVRLSVDSNRRRQGIGLSIIQRLINEARILHLEKIQVETNLDWSEAIRLYRNVGFEEVGRDSGSIYFSLDL